MPYTLSQEEFTALLEKYENQFPVPVVSIAHDLGLEVYETSDFEESQSGSLRKENGQFVIYVNAAHPETRKRFTIAHEIGHYLQDRDYFDAHKEHITTLRQPSFSELNRSNDEQNPQLKNRDFRANRFAAELLMPPNKFKEVCLEASAIEDIANFFNVSTSAASIRASELMGLVFI